MFTVHWLQSALNELAAIWIRADSELRQAITSAANLLETQLQQDPEQQGESRNGHQRVHHAPPLGISYQVNPDNRTVLIFHVWHVRRRNK